MSEAIWNAMSREAGIAAEHMAAGATILGRANYAYHAHYGQAFFDLSIGFERGCKLALVIDHALKNSGQFPAQAAIRKHGHQLDTLLERTDQLAMERDLSGYSRLPKSNIHFGIVRILTNFASNITRYYNLDVITGGLRVTGQLDPVADWYNSVTTPILEQQVSRRRIDQVERNARLIDEMAGQFMMVRHTSESGDSLNSPYSASRQTGLTGLAKPYERMCVLQIARFVGSVLSELGYAAHKAGIQEIPYLSEFFAIFHNSDSYLRRRKTWSIYPG